MRGAGDIDGKPFSVAKIAAYMRVPRTTVIRRLERLQGWGLIDRRGRHYYTHEKTLNSLIGIEGATHSEQGYERIDRFGHFAGLTASLQLHSMRADRVAGCRGDWGPHGRQHDSSSISVSISSGGPAPRFGACIGELLGAYLSWLRTSHPHSIARTATRSIKLSKSKSDLKQLAAK